MRKLFPLLSALTVTLFLAACDTAEERAEEHYQNALTLLQEGDPDRAIVELRNVFSFVGNHLGARHELARIFLEEKENPQQAFSQYLRIAEQYPDDLKARMELSEIAFFGANWEEMERHGSKSRELDPTNRRVQVIGAALDYRAAIEEEDDAAITNMIRVARSLMDPTDPERILRELILDNHLRKLEMSEALAMLDELTTEFPDTQRYWRQRLQVSLSLGDQSAIEKQLVDLVERFPEDAEQKQMLVRYFLSRGEIEKTEAFLRQMVSESPEGEIGLRVDLIRFLIELRGIDVARAEINDAIETEADPAPFIMLGTALDFTSGNTEKAISELEAAIATAEPTDQTNEMKISLARMLLATGNDVGARSLVEAVLLDDGTQVGALKMNARWLIEADDTDSAIAALRTALDKNSDDPDALTLMASAYNRAGSKDLARDFLSLAVEASGNAPTETVRYVQLLITEERYLPAEDVLLPAIRIAPNNVELLRVAAELYLGMADLGRMQQVIETLRRIDTEESNQLAVQLEVARLNQNSGSDEAMDYLEGLASGADADFASRVLLLRARLATGDVESAVELAEALSAEEPDSPAAKLVLATTVTVAGDLERAMDIYGVLAEQFPEEAGLQVEIATLQERNGDPESARETINAAIETSPTNARLLWASASYLEIDGDIDGAIAIYEELYELDSNSIVVANNLASLIATYRDDDASLERAWTIARRFREADQPAIQDTYGWIAHRRGNSNEALPYLQSAAAALKDDAIVQFHLAEALFALGQNEQALDQYRLSLDAAGIGDTRRQIEQARARIIEIQQGSEATE